MTRARIWPNLHYPHLAESVVTDGVPGVPQIPEADPGNRGWNEVKMKRVLSVILLSLTMVACSSDSPEATVTSSGLQIEELVVGEGESARVGATAVVHYTGWLVDGTKFDSSVDRDSPFDFVIGEGRVIKGWDEGVATMRVGGKRKLTIPPDLAYGDRGAGDVIPPGATLVFEVELLEVR